MRLLTVLAALALATPALAAAPQPARAVAPAVYSGRWYEIARTPNLGQGDCQAATSDFTGWTGSAFKVVQTCHKGSPLGPLDVHPATATIMPGSGNAKLKMAFLGGLIRQEYWILDHADDYAWAIMATPGGHFVWLLARRPALDAQTRAAAIQRLRTLGYDVSKLAWTAQIAPRNIVR
jgi:apolipoprotein D and lipocalin family protein